MRTIGGTKNIHGMAWNLMDRTILGRAT
jgi:hypothetical protein